MPKVCMICGETESVKRELFVKDGNISRIFDFCPLHWSQVYRKCLDDLMEEDEYRISAYIKSVADKYIGDAIFSDKIDEIQSELDKSVDAIESIDELGADHIKLLNGVVEE